MPKIYVFSAEPNGREGPCYAMAEDGTILESHWCSCEGYAPHDLGVVEGSHPDRHKAYRAHYPDGYEMEFIPADALEAHPGHRAARERNMDQRKRAAP